MKRNTILGVWLVLICGLWSGSLLAAQQSEAGQASPPATIEQVEARLAEVDALAGIDDASRAALREQYQKALGHLREANRLTTLTVELERKAAGANDELDEIRKELATPATEPSTEVPADAQLSQLEQLLKQAEVDLANARRAVTDLEEQSNYRKERRTLVPGLIAEARRRLAEIESGLLAAPSPDVSVAQLAARRIAQQAETQFLLAQIDQLGKEIASYDARIELLPARRDQAQRRVGEAEKRVSAWQALVAVRRNLDAERSQKEARQSRLAAARKSQQLLDEAVKNEKRAAGRTGPDGLNSKLEASSLSLSERKAALEDMRKRFRSVRDRVRLAGLNTAMSKLLRQELAAIPDDVEKMRRNRGVRREKISDAQLKELELADERKELAELNAKSAELVNEIDPGGVREDRLELEAVALEILTGRRDLLDALKADQEVYVRRLVELDETTELLVAAADEFRSYIEERIFAVRSIEGGLLPSPRATAEALAWLGNGPAWRDAVRGSVAHVRKMSVGTTGLALLLVALVVLRRRARQRLRFTGEQVRRIRTDSIRWSFEALLWTIVVAAPLALLIWLCGTLLARVPGQPEQAVAVGEMLRVAATPLLALLFLRTVVRKGGLAEAHFRWPDVVRTALARSLRWFVPVYLGLLGLVLVVQPPWGEEKYNDSLGRLAFGAAMLVLTLFVKRVLAPQGPVLGTYISRNPTTLLARLRMVWFPVMVIVPVALFVLTVVGYDYTAVEIHRRFLQTLILISALVPVAALLLRWLYVERRRLAFEQARLRREAAKAEAAAEAAAAEGVVAGEGGKSTPPPVEEVDVPAINAQTLQLLRSAMIVVLLLGLYGIWSELFPALQFFERVQVYPEFRLVDSPEEGRYPVLDQNGTAKPAADSAVSATTAAAGGTTEGASNPASPVRTGIPPVGAVPGATADTGSDIITLADIGLAVVLLFLTFICARNIPGLTEILLLRRLSLDQGARYAATTLARYAIVVAGMSLAFGALGMGWAKVQWLAAAMTFGLAFGLQEIFANFVSGVIILFERPARIGDVVTVGGVNGKVTKIRMRATTITDWDNRELIVPNKEFVTGQLINWTLSDPVTRVVIPVGIAYSANPAKAKELLQKVAQECPFVMEVPPPSAIFRQFGESSLLMELRSHIATRDVWPQMVDTLHHRIHAEFARAGIEIAFPQLDLHVRSADGLKRSSEPWQKERE